MYWEYEPPKRRYIFQITIAVSIGLHVLVWAGLTHLGTRPAADSYLVQLVVARGMMRATPPPPTPPPATPTPPPTPKPTPAPTPVAPPPNQETKNPDAEPPKPVFGVTEESVVEDSSFAVRVGNTLMQAQEKDFTDPSKVKPYAPQPVKQQAIKANAPPKLRSKVDPEYPALARKAGREGRVVLRVLIGADGHVKSVTVVRAEPPDFGFEQAAVEAVQQWVYSPPGEGVDTWFFQPVRFSLEE